MSRHLFSRARVGIVLSSMLILVLCVSQVLSAHTAAQAHFVAPPATSTNAWSIVPSPNAAGTLKDLLYSDAAISTNDVWAVGAEELLETNIYQTLVEHWDGTSWSIIPSPNDGTDGNALQGVAAVSSSNVWAVGSYTGTQNEETLIEQWDGTSWSIVPSPDVSGSNNYLQSIAVVTATDIWAVGYSSVVNASSQSLIEHWDGTSWSMISGPHSANGETLWGCQRFHRMMSGLLGVTLMAWATHSRLPNSGMAQPGPLFQAM